MANQQTESFCSRPGCCVPLYQAGDSVMPRILQGPGQVPPMMPPGIPPTVLMAPPPPFDMPPPMMVPPPPPFDMTPPMMMPPPHPFDMPPPVMVPVFGPPPQPIPMHPGMFEGQPIFADYIPEQDPLSNMFVNMKLQNQPQPIDPSPIAPELEPTVPSLEALLAPTQRVQHFPPGSGLVDITIPIMMGHGTLRTLLPASEWASASQRMQQKVLRDEIDSKYVTGPSLYQEMKALAFAGKLEKTDKPCEFCVSNQETEFFSNSHVLKDEAGIVRCPVLRRFTCKTCNATGDNAHTAYYCPLKEKDKEPEEEGKIKKRTKYVGAKNSTGGIYLRKY